MNLNNDSQLNLKNVREGSTLGNVTSDGATINVGENTNISIAKLTNDTHGTAINTDSLAARVNITKNENTNGLTDAKMIEDVRTATVVSPLNANRLTVNLSREATSQLSGSTNLELAQSAAVVVTTGTGSDAYQMNIAEGAIAGQIQAIVGANGQILWVTEGKNETLGELMDLGFNNFQVFRSQMNDLDKRMGDLRTMPAASGAWARAIAGQSQYKSTHNTYKTLQVGVDHRMGNFFGGVMGSYTDGDGTVRMGDTDDKNYSFGLYGGYLADNGMFVDVTVKRHHLATDYDLRYQSGDKAKGSYHTSGTSVSLETGWRLPISNTNFYVEPQVEFMYGHLDSVSYTTSNGVKVNQDSSKTAVGRLGAAIGYVDPNKAGSAYFKASVLNDWEGDARTKVSKGSITRRYHDDMGGTWGEFALGGTYNLSNDWSVYGEAETTAGSPVRTTYQFSAGVRYSF